MKIPKSLIECVVVVIILLFFEALQLNAIFKGNFAAQDFQRHSKIIATSAQNSFEAFTTFSGGRGTPCTLYHFIGGRIYNLVSKSRVWLTIAMVNCMVNIVALSLFYFFLRRIINSLTIRISCFMFIVFLPLTIITCVVIASDAFMAPLFVSIIWVVLLIVERLKKGKNCLGWIIAGCVLLLITCAMNFIYVLCLLSILLIGLILGWCQILDWRQLRTSFCMLVFVPLVAYAFMYFAFISYQSQAVLVTPWEPVSYFVIEDTHHHRHLLAEKRMNFQSLFFLKKTDKQLLQAPGFQSGKFQENNAFSYPAMLHLAIFTDFLNIYQPIRLASNAPGFLDEYYNRIRSTENQKKMCFAVCSGLLFSVALIIALGWMVLRIVGLVWRKELKIDDSAILIILTFSLVLFCGLSLGLPFAHFVYGTGIWLPRHIMPSIISFFIILFVALEGQVIDKIPWARWIILLIVILQSALHVSFLWTSS